MECPKYETQREDLVQVVKKTIVREEWEKRLEEDDEAIWTVLGLCGGREETERIVKAVRKYLTSSWENRTRIGIE